VTDKLVLLDVNVPMYAAGRSHPYKEACTWIMTEIAEGRLAVAIDTQTIQEILHRYGALHEWSTAVTMAASLLELVSVVYSVHASDAHQTVHLFDRYASRGVKARDLMHVAVGQSNGIGEIVSTDRHFDDVKEVVRTDPIAVFEHSRLQRG